MSFVLVIQIFHENCISLQEAYLQRGAEGAAALKYYRKIKYFKVGKC